MRNYTKNKKKLKRQEAETRSDSLTNPTAYHIPHNHNLQVTPLQVHQTTELLILDVSLSLSGKTVYV